MTTLIPLPGDRHVIGEGRHSEWRVGDRFIGPGGWNYQFLGRDNVGGLHARRENDQRLMVFESANTWQAFPTPKH